MTLTFKILGYEVARLDLDIEHDDPTPPVIDQGIKKMSRWWVGRMAR